MFQLHLLGRHLCVLMGLLVYGVVGTAMAEPKRNIVGYSSEWSVRPGETIDFYVNAIGGGSYEADLVRVINGDSQSRYANMFRVEAVDAPFAKEYEGVEQPLNTGSYVHVEDPKPLDGLGSFTVAAWIYPTFNPDEYEAPDLENIDPFSPPTLTIAPSVKEQTIVSRFDAETGTGWSLQLDEEARLSFVADTGDGKLQTIRIDDPLRTWDWAYVAASYEAKDRAITLDLIDKPWAPGDRFTGRQLEEAGKLEKKLVQEGPLRIAAVRAGPGAAESKLEKPGAVFNGRIQDVRVAKRVLSAKEIDRLSAETVPDGLKDTVVADWDFAKDMKTTRIRDVAGGVDGVAVNVPDRAVRGVFWDGSTTRWTDDPDGYDAITFHTDDLYDAEWESDFSYVVPPDLKSGIYAARIVRGDFTEYITFFVAAPEGRPGADLALWLSDYNYLAYSNISLAATAGKNYPGHNFNDDDTEFYKANPEYATGGVYNTHVDGLYFSYGSRLRPDLQMKPGAMVYNFAQDTHITAFLEHEGIEYDVITDEMVDREGVDLLKRYRAVISSTHHEYVTTGEFDAVRDYTAEGGRFIYIGGNGWFWSVGGHPQLPGVMESRNFHDIAERYLRSGARGGLMIEAGRPSGPVFGNEMAGMIFNGSSAYRRLEDSKDKRARFLFEGTEEGEVFGDYGPDRVHGGAAGFEIDRYNPANGVPRHALHLATSEPLKPTIEDVTVGVLPLNIKYHPSKGEPWAQADLVFFETPNGGAMLSTGSITWISAALENDFDNDIAKITGNAIRRFLDPKPFPKIDEDDVDEALDRTPPGGVYEHADQQ